MIKNILAGTVIFSLCIGNTFAANFTGVTICNETAEPVIIDCNGHSAPPIPSRICLPATWKEMATSPIFFGGSKKDPVFHFTCQWFAKNSGQQIMSTVMDISKTYSTGKVTQVVINAPYSAYTQPNPIPDEYISSIYVKLQKAKINLLKFKS